MAITTPDLFEILKPYRVRIDSKLQELINSLGGPALLREACAYALSNGGKRFRPVLVLMIANALDPKRNVDDAAASIECFHTASLIADDLPCMDDDDERRDKPSVHKLYGEATALLASYALISEGYSCIIRNIQKLKGHEVVNGLQALENVTLNTGIKGATGGQFLDLDPPNSNLETLLSIHQMKTSALFETAFVLGWLFGGGSRDQLDLVKRTSVHFGLAFQIADDLQDLAQDLSQGVQVNIALIKGESEAKRLFRGEMESLRKGLQDLNLYSQDIRGLVNLLDSGI